MNNFIIWAAIIVICLLAYKIFDYLSVRLYRNGHTILPGMLCIISIISLIFFAICLMSGIIVLVITALSPLR